jgi:2-methylisocitrate lyase-like PEP mutase family enzyme
MAMSKLEHTNKATPEAPVMVDRTELTDDQLKSASELDDNKLDTVTGGATAYDIVKTAMDARVKELKAEKTELLRSSGCLGPTSQF